MMDMMQTLAAPVVAAMQSVMGPPPFTPADKAIISASLADFDGRSKAMRAAWRAYMGHLERPLKIRRDGIDDNLLVNLMRPVVNVSAFFLVGKPPALDLPEPNGAPDGTDPATEAWENTLNTALAANGWEGLLLDTALNGAVCGDVYWRFMPGDNEGDPPRLVNLDPANCTILAHPQDISRETGFVFQYNSVDARNRPCVYRLTFCKDALGGWQIVEEQGNGTYPDWRLTGPPTPWPYPWCPVLHCKNLPNPNSPYGLPDITPDLIDLNRGENFILSNQARILRYHAHPKTWVSGMGGHKVDFAIDEVINIPSTDGRVGVIAPTVSSDAAGNLSREIKEMVCEMSQTPSISLGRDDQAGDPSGVAIELKFGPLVQKTHVKRALYGPFLVEACRRLLEMLNYGPNGRVTLAWQEVLPTDLAKIAPALNLGVLGGYISKKSAANKWGLDWAEEQSNMAAETLPPADRPPVGAYGPNTPPVDTAQDSEETPYGGEG